MASAAGSLFARIYAGHTGVDPYTTAVSDTYQDLFGEGSLHRQGALRRRRLHRRARRARPRERAALARPLRGALRAHRAGHRRRGGRRLPGERARPRPPPAPLGARRLADPRAGCFPVVPDARRASRATACRSSPAGRSSTTCAAAWCRRRLLALLLAALDGAARAARCAWTGGRPRRARLPARAARCSRSLGGAAAAAAVARLPARRRARTLSTALAQALPAARLPRRTRPGRWCTPSALTLVRLVVTQRRLLEWETAAAQRGARRRPRPARRGLLRRRWRPARWSRPLGLRRWWRSRRARRAAAGGRRRAAALGRGAVARLRAQPPRAAAPAPSSAPRTARFLRERRAQDLALLRDVRRAPTTTGCRPTTSRRRPSRASPTAPRRPTSAWACSRRSRRTTSASSPPTSWSRASTQTLTTVEGLERHEGHLLNWYDTQNLAPLPPALRLDRRQRQPRGRAVALAEGCRGPGAARRRSRRALAAGAARRALADGMNFALPLRPAAPALLDRLPPRRRRRAGPARRAPTTTCSPPRRAWPASSPSPRATCRRATGSTSGRLVDERRRRARRCCRGAPRCSST